MRMDALLARTRKGLTTFWCWLRELSEDTAYDRYLAAANRDCAQMKLTAADFYRQRLEHKYSRPSRCC